MQCYSALLQYTENTYFNVIYTLCMQRYGAILQNTRTLILTLISMLQCSAIAQLQYCRSSRQREEKLWVYSLLWRSNVDWLSRGTIQYNPVCHHDLVTSCRKSLCVQNVVSRHLVRLLLLATVGKIVFCNVGLNCPYRTSILTLILMLTCIAIAQYCSKRKTRILTLFLHCVCSTVA